MDKKNINMETKSILVCRGLKPKVFVTLDYCARCENHGGVKEISKAFDIYPAQFVTICSIPVEVKVVRMAEGE